MKHSGHTPRNEEDDRYVDDHNEKEILSQNQEDKQS